MASKLIWAKDVMWEELDGQALLVDTATGERWSFNAAALSIWKQCDGAASIAEIAGRFERARHEVSEFCEVLLARGLVRKAQSNVLSSVGTVAALCGLPDIPIIKPLGLGNNARRRPSPRGNSGPG